MHPTAMARFDGGHRRSCFRRNSTAVPSHSPTYTYRKKRAWNAWAHTHGEIAEPTCWNVPPMLIWIVYFAQDETHLPFSARMQREYHFRISSFACLLVRQDPCSAQRPGSGRVCQRTTTWGASADACGAMGHTRRGRGRGSRTLRRGDPPPPKSEGRWGGTCLPPGGRPLTVSFEIPVLETQRVLPGLGGRL